MRVPASELRIHLERGGVGDAAARAALVDLAERVEAIESVLDGEPQPSLLEADHQNFVARIRRAEGKHA